MKKFKAHQLEFDEIINTTTSNEFAKITMVSSTDANNAAANAAADVNANEQRGNDANDGLGARHNVAGQGGNDGAEEARDAAEHNGDNSSNNDDGDNRNEGETNSTYIYQDFAQAADDNDQDDDEDVNDVTAGHKQSTNQKLPKKLAAMLCDPDLVTCITWMPHGRSWKILNRDLFSRYALLKYFGHTNHASFIRIVNAWGFRRIIQPGPDRDTYYHELFLRSKPKLHNRMKRLPTTHRKTPMDKDECAPNFYELSERSPLPETVWERRSESGGGIGMMSGGMSHSTNNVRIGMGGGGAHFGDGMMDGYVGSGGGGMMRMAHQQMIGGGSGQSAVAAMGGMGMMHHGMNPMMPPSRAATASAASPFVYPPPDGAGGSYVPSNLTLTSAAAAAAAAAGKQQPQDNTTTATTTTTTTNDVEKERLIHLQKENDILMRQLLELSSKLSSKSSSSNNNKEEGGSSSTTEDIYTETVVRALQRDNERLIHEIMSLQEQLPVELRMDIHAELFDQSSGGEEESSKKKKKKKKKAS